MVCLGEIAPFEGEGIALEAESAKAEPLIAAHLFDQDLLGGGGGLVFVHEVGEEGFEFLGVFAGR